MEIDRKEVFGDLFRGYIKITGNPQSVYRKEAADEIREALDQIRKSGTSFDELAADKTYAQLIMVTDQGMERFISFVHDFIEHGYDDVQSNSDIVDEQIRIAKWVREHKKELTV